MLIAENEGVKCESEAVFDALIESSEGDLRRSINTLQTASAANLKDLSSSSVYEISGIVPNDYIKTLLQTLCESDNTQEHASLIQNIIYDGWDVQQVLHQMLDQVISMSSKKMPDLKKAKVSEIIAETDSKLIEGGNEEINLTYALTFIASIIQGTDK
jgi:DNA polymerase III delta prime subunit